MAISAGRISQRRAGRWPIWMRLEITRTLEESIRRGRADDPGTRDPAEMLRGFGLMKDGQLLRAAMVLFGRAERIEAELAARVAAGGALSRARTRPSFSTTGSFTATPSICC